MVHKFIVRAALTEPIDDTKKFVKSLMLILVIGIKIGG